MARQRRPPSPVNIKEDSPKDETKTTTADSRPPSPVNIKEDSAMNETKTATADSMHVAGKAMEAMSLWADANQRILGQLMELSAGAAKESARLYAELQQTTVDVLRETQATALRWQSTWPEALKDPVRFCQQTFVESVDGAQKAFRLVEGNAQAVARSAERWQASAEQAGRGIQETVKTTVGKMKDVYSL